MTDGERYILPPTRICKPSIERLRQRHCRVAEEARSRKAERGSCKSRAKGANQRRDAWKAKLLRARRRLTVAGGLGRVANSNQSPTSAVSRGEELLPFGILSAHACTTSLHLHLLYWNCRRQTSFGIRRLYGRITGSSSSSPPSLSFLLSFTHRSSTLSSNHAMLAR